MAKDFVIATGKETFTGAEINQYFEDKSLLNYLNLLILEALQTFETFLIETGKIREVFFTD